MTFYLAISAALLGYVFTQDLERDLKQAVLTTALVIAALFLPVLWFGFRRLYGLLKALEASIEHIATRRLAEDLGVKAEFAHWRRAQLVVCAAIFAVDGVLIGAMLTLLISL